MPSSVGQYPEQIDGVVALSFANSIAEVMARGPSVEEALTDALASVQGWASSVGLPLDVPQMVNDLVTSTRAQLGDILTGSAVGLNPLLVLAAVFLGGAIAGPHGAVFGAPVLAALGSVFVAWLDHVRPEGSLPPPAEGIGGAPSTHRDRVDQPSVQGPAPVRGPGIVSGSGPSRR